MFKDGHSEYLELTVLEPILKDNTVQTTGELMQAGSLRPHCPGFTGCNYAGSCLVFASERMLNNVLQLSALFRFLLVSRGVSIVNTIQGTEAVISHGDSRLSPCCLGVLP